MDIKLQPKQLALLNEIQKKKQELSAAFAELNSKESLILELILEVAGISSSDVTEVTLNQDSISYKLKEKKSKDKKPKR